MIALNDALPQDILDVNLSFLFKICKSIRRRKWLNYFIFEELFTSLCFALLGRSSPHFDQSREKRRAMKTIMYQFRGGLKLETLAVFSARRTGPGGGGGGGSTCTFFTAPVLYFSIVIRGTWNVIPAKIIDKHFFSQRSKRVKLARISPEFCPDLTSLRPISPEIFCPNCLHRHQHFFFLGGGGWFHVLWYNGRSAALLSYVRYQESLQLFFSSLSTSIPDTITLFSISLCLMFTVN